MPNKIPITTGDTSIIIPERDNICIYHDKILHINFPFYVSDVKVDEKDYKIEIKVSYNPKLTFACPCCGKTGLKIHSKYPRVWRTLDISNFEAFIKMDAPNVSCPDCEHNTIDIPWARRFSRLTELFEARMLALATSLSMTAASRFLNIDANRISLVVNHYTTKARKELDMSQTAVVGFDEKSILKGHKYITTAVDMEKRNLLFATSGKDHNALGEFAEDLIEHNGNPDNIKDVAIDMSIPFQTGVKLYFPNAKITFDKFHVMANMGKVLDAVRNEEVRTEPLLKNTKFTLLKTPAKLTEREVIRLAQLSKRKLKTVRTYNFSLQLREAFGNKDYDDAKYHFKRLIKWAKLSRIPQLREFGFLLQNHLDGILRYIITGLTSGLVEGMNSRIQEIKSRAKGFSNIPNLINILYVSAILQSRSFILQVNL